MLKTSCAAAVALALVLGVLFSVPAIGSRKADSPVTFSKDVAPIFYKNCVSCHRPGEAAPMSLVTYQDTRPWAKSIRAQVLQKTMPPWNADPHFGKFRNERRLAQQEIDTIVAWIDQGSRQGNPAETPPVPQFPDGWTVGTPDAILSMAEEFDVPAEGVVEYKYFTVPTNFTEDRWVEAAEIRAGNREVVHHVIVFVDEPGGSPTRAPGIQITSNQPAGQASSSATSATAPGATPAAPSAPAPSPSAAPAGAAAVPNRPAAAPAQPRQGRRLGTFLVGFAPGTQPTVFTPGSAKRIKPGSTLTFQMHYTPNGAAAKDRTRVGLLFSKQPAAHELRTVAVLNSRFVIPAGDPNFKVDSHALFTEDVKIWSLFPHMHVRGKDFEYRLVYPDGRSSVILSVPKYEFNWQGEYTFTQPLTAPKGSRLECTAHFDNSRDNPANPDPTDNVRWGDQTWEEMMIGWTTFSIESGRSTTPSSQR